MSAPAKLFVLAAALVLLPLASHADNQDFQGGCPSTDAKVCHQFQLLLNKHVDKADFDIVRLKAIEDIATQRSMDRGDFTVGFAQNADQYAKALVSLDVMPDDAAAIAKNWDARRKATRANAEARFSSQALKASTSSLAKSTNHLDSIVNGLDRSALLRERISSLRDEAKMPGVKEVDAHKKLQEAVRLQHVLDATMSANMSAPAKAVR